MLTKKIRFTLFFILLSVFGIAQTNAFDSIKTQLALTYDDTSRTLMMLDLSDLYKFNNPDSSLYYSHQALILSRNIYFIKGQFRSYYRMGFSLGVLGNYPRALEMQLKALHLAEKYNFIDEKAPVLTRFGTIYRDAGELNKSMFYLKQAEHLSDSLKGYPELSGAQNLIARDYLIMNELDSAQLYAQKSFDNINKYNVEFMRCPNLVGLGRIQSKLKNDSLALYYFRESVKYADQYDGYIYNTQSFLEMAKIYYRHNQLDSCLLYATKSLEVAQTSNLYNNIIETSLFLSSFYEDANPILALNYQKIANVAHEKLLKFGNISEVQNRLAFDEEERQYEIESEQTAYRNKYRQYALITGLSIMLLVGFLLYRNNSQKQKANKVLESTLTHLKFTQTQLIQSEKMASLGELTAGIAHEIQNPLNFVNNFSEVNKEMLEELKAERIKPNAERDDDLQNDLINDVIANSEKINHHGKRAADIVKGMLQHSQTSSSVKEPTNINALAEEYLRLAYHACLAGRQGLRAKDKDFNATMKTDFDESIGNINIIPQDIGRVILNLINNAFYAIDEKKKSGIEGYEPTVSVSTKKVSDKVLITIKDNGNGIPQKILDKIFQPFFTTKPTGQGTGLGLSLAYDLVKAHGGSIEVISKEGEGTTFILKIPII